MADIKSISEFETQHSLLDMNTVLRMINVSRRTLYRMIEHDGFPKPYKISGVRIAWTQGQIIEWIANLKHAQFKDSHD